MKTSFAMLAAAAAVLAAGSAQGQDQDQRYGGGGWNGGRVPPGSYQDSCRSVAVRGDNLTASCRDNRGRWNYSSIRFRDCRRDIGNDNGRLVCDYGGGGGGYYPPGGGGRPPWGGGGGRSGISLFSAPDFGGQQYVADREVTNLPKQYNDRAMSVRIEGRGSWQICSDSDFRGRCQIVDRDIRDLRQFGLGEAISSMRPVGGGRPY